MKQIKTHEERLLEAASSLVKKFVSGNGGDAVETRFQILEAAASRIGGFDIQGFQGMFGIHPVVHLGRLMDAAQGVVAAIKATGIPPALALSALAREEITHANKRADGVYNTDFRLAQHLASTVQVALRPGARILDPACGAGMLLAAVSLVACGPDRVLAADWLRESVNAADLSKSALRGALLALACLTNDLSALKEMRSRWVVQDSLLAPECAWSQLAPKGFDVIVANPPWEKVKLSRHEFIKRRGGSRHYGSSYEGHDLAGYEADRLNAAARSAALAELYPALASGEPDLYVAFTEFMLRVTRPGGSGAILIPGGIIRSQGTECLRRLLLRRSQSLSFTVMENRAKFFPIDTRFKFALCRFDTTAVGRRPRSTVHLMHASGEESGLRVSKAVAIARKIIPEMSSDLTLPEVRNPRELRLFLKLQRGGHRWSDPESLWHPDFCREVDMTKCSSAFKRKREALLLPLVEGRMVQPHRFGAKTYEGGQGRRARWTMLPPGASQTKPQFWISRAALPTAALVRCDRLRAGFCDITGQTNERSMMAALIPPGVACGNKVPTVVFPKDPSQERLYLWTAIVNSVPFDWALRRVVTTTVNYFLLLGLNLPKIEPDSLPGRRLVDIATRLSAMDRAGTTGTEVAWRAGELRAEADALVASGYGLAQDDLLCMFEDFPLLDRGQAPLPGDERSTITRDCVLAKFSTLRRGGGQEWAVRVKAAKLLGAVPYMPGEFSTNELEVSDVA